MDREALITASFELAAEKAGDLTPLVYERLFREHPEMEALFWRDKNHQVKGEMLSQVAVAILDFVGPRRYSSQLIRTEVINHAGYDVPPEVFRLFFGVVRDSMKAVCGADWTADIDAAWSSTLTDLDAYATLNSTAA
ncbi:MAG TPA: globin [Phenylobacterium sp.]|jgi:hemoglobin-like flavoprotein|nr:globin [Phenylobacterium sp.]HQN50843.1 globin [Phenylobacterium sp.]HQP21460.1 globin [Phenylobacterium sp.]